MSDLIDGAVNDTSAGSPTAENGTQPDTSPAPGLGSQSATDSTGKPIESASQPVSEGQQAEGQQAEGQDAQEGVGSPEGAGREKFIPRERFDQINTRAQELEQQAQAARQEAQEWREAAALGIPSAEQYRGIIAEAKSYGYPDAATYLAAVQQQHVLQQQIAEVENRFDLSDEAKQELIAAKQERLQNQQQLQQARYLNQQMLSRTLETAVTEAKATIGHDLPPELETLLRQTSPENIAVAAKSIKALLDSTTKNGVAQYAATKAKDAAIATPEGRGGDPPAPTRASGGKDFKNISFRELLMPTRTQ